MLKQMILVGLLAATAAPAFASDASYDLKAAPTQISTHSKADVSKHDCSCTCQKHHA
jgi:hypothetical protein